MYLSEPEWGALLVGSLEPTALSCLPLLSALGVGGHSLGGVAMTLPCFAQDRLMNIKILKLTCFLCILLS